MNHPDPIIETRNKYNQTRNTLAAAREQRARLAAELERLESSIGSLEIELAIAEDAYTAAIQPKG